MHPSSATSQRPLSVYKNQTDIRKKREEIVHKKLYNSPYYEANLRLKRLRKRRIIQNRPQSKQIDKDSSRGSRKQLPDI